MCFLWNNKFLFLHLLARKYNFINIVKKSRIFFAYFFVICPNFWQMKTFADAFAPPVTPASTPRSVSTKIMWVPQSSVHRGANGATPPGIQVRGEFKELN